MALSADNPDWWKDAVLYQVYPRSFQDTNGDGIGDLKGISARLDYLVELGVDGLWISPFFKSPMKDFGYDVEDHRAIDPMFGTLDDFDALLSAAHERGLRILIDLVLSHSAETHPWFEESRRSRQGPKADYFVWAEPGPDGGYPNNWLSIFGGPAWTWEPARQQYYLHNFLTEQPDLNFHHPDVSQEALDIARWWLERGVDGFRLDTVNFYFHDQALRDNPSTERLDYDIVPGDNPYGEQAHLYDKNQGEVTGFLESLGSILAEYPGSIALGEVGAARKRALPLMREYQKPGRLQLCYSFDLLSDQLSVDHFRAILPESAGHDLADWRCVAFSNHDVVRTATRFGSEDSEESKIAPLAMTLLLTMRGTPCIYQGEELGLPEAQLSFEDLVDPYGIAFWPEFKGRDGCRTPMPWDSTQANFGFSSADARPWLPAAEPHGQRSVDRQVDQPDSMLTLTRALLKLRRECSALRRGSFNYCADVPDGLLVFERRDGALSVQCGFNLSGVAVKIPMALGLSERHLPLSDGIEQGSPDGDYEIQPWGWWIAT